MPPMRRPFIPPTATVSGGGAPVPGMGMPPNPTMTGPQPQMTMGGAPSNATGGGPTSPFNISPMLQTQQPPNTMGPAATAQPSPMQVGSPLAPWGDQGNGSAVNPNAPKRLPVSSSYGRNDQGYAQADAPSPEQGGGGADMNTFSSGLMNNNSTVMMRMLRSMGRI